MSQPDEPDEGGRLRIVVVDDHELFRRGVVGELAEFFAVVGEASTVDEAVAVIEATSPAVVLLDVHIGSASGREVVERVARTHPDVRFLALSVSDAATDVIGLVRAGARGYVTKSITAPELRDAVERVAEGDAVFSPRLAGFVLDAFASGSTVTDPELDLLTAREQEVMRLLARGYAYKEIARELTISVKTVETHASSVLRKLQLSSRHELSRWATERRIV
ncbi:MAG TPA: response regulator transcription factor [Microthrixaceae bacterium]|nr:response regulator transcription factor [Microthrixaceae bacterium]